MAKLCKEIDSIFSESVVGSLQLKNITTVNDFLKERPEKIAAITELPYQVIVQVRYRVIAKFSAISRTGTEIYNEVAAGQAVVSTGIESFNSLLGGGFLTGNVYEICGPSGCGKTQLCLTLAMNISLYLKQAIYYIDPKMNFSSQRIFSMMTAREIPDYDKMEALKRIEVVKINNIFELFSFGRILREDLIKRDYPPFLRLIIIDSLLDFFTSSDDDNDDRARLFQFALFMRQAAREFHVIFLITNLGKNVQHSRGLERSSDNTVPLPSETVEPALGNLWTTIPSTQLLMNKDCSQIQIKVFKSLCLKRNTFCVLNITDHGIE